MRSAKVELLISGIWVMQYVFLSQFVIKNAKSELHWAVMIPQKVLSFYYYSSLRYMFVTFHFL